MNFISAAAVPLMIGGIIFCGLIKEVPIYDTFIKGAFEGLKSSVRILPALVALVTAVSMLRASGALDLLCHALSPVTNLISFPSEVLPMALLRSVSGSASIATLKNIFDTSGPDSFAGKVASVISGSTETTFYTLSVYFAATKAKDTRHTLKCGLLADFTGMIAGAIIVSLLL